MTHSLSNTDSPACTHQTGHKRRSKTAQPTLYTHIATPRTLFSFIFHCAVSQSKRILPIFLLTIIHPSRLLSFDQRGIELGSLAKGISAHRHAQHERLVQDLPLISTCSTNRHMERQQVVQRWVCRSQVLGCCHILHRHLLALLLRLCSINMKRKSNV